MSYMLYGVLQNSTAEDALQQRFKMALRIVKKAKDKRMATATKYGFVYWTRG